jgi:hypothetical protein
MDDLSIVLFANFDSGNMAKYEKVNKTVNNNNNNSSSTSTSASQSSSTNANYSISKSFYKFFIFLI